MTVYILRLASQKYYVGLTVDLATRLAEHWMGKGSQWTRLYEPLEVLKTQPGNRSLEDALTIALMARFGMANVRGGRWCSIELLSMPLPLARALARQPRRPLPESRGWDSETLHGQLIVVRRVAGGFAARVTGPLVVAAGREEVNRRGLSVGEAKAKAVAWVEGAAARSGNECAPGGKDHGSQGTGESTGSYDEHSLSGDSAVP
jgi:hypothetical protein